MGEIAQRKLFDKLDNLKFKENENTIFIRAGINY